MPGVQRPERGAVHKRPFGAELKKTWSYNSTLSYVFMVCTGSTSHTLIYIHGDENSSSEKEDYLLTADQLVILLNGKICTLVSTDWLISVCNIR